MMTVQSGERASSLHFLAIIQLVALMNVGPFENRAPGACLSGHSRTKEATLRLQSIFCASAHAHIILPTNKKAGSG